MLSQARLKELFNYDPETGFFTNIGRRGETCAGHLNTTGYRQIRIDGKLFCAHRLVWLYVHGAFPTEYLDHINRNKDDNRICNLREANRSQNNRNGSRRRNNKTGVPGVCLASDRYLGNYRAFIRIDGKQKDLGIFETLAEAAAVRKAAELKYFGEFAPKEAA